VSFQPARAWHRLLLALVVGSLFFPSATYATRQDDAASNAFPALTSVIPEAPIGDPLPQESVRPPGLPPAEPIYGTPAYLSLPGGTIVEPRSFYSPTLERPMLYEVILPPGYGRELSYPVLYLLHGYGGWSHSWIELRLHQTADYLWSENRLQPFIIVLADGENSYFLNHADGGPRWADYLAEDLVQEIDTAFLTRPEAPFRAIGGLSMGGDGALQLALNRPDVFSIVGAHSPTTRLTFEQVTVPYYGDEAYWQQHNPLWLMQQAGSMAQLTIWIDAGTEDEWLPSARALHDVLQAGSIPHWYAEIEGGHGAAYWIANQPAYLHFYAEAFTHSQTARLSSVF
jgi:enterochelin esterase-like enzyme